MAIVEINYCYRPENSWPISIAYHAQSSATACISRRLYFHPDIDNEELFGYISDIRHHLLKGYGPRQHEARAATLARLL